MLVSTAVHIEPETAPVAVDQRPYVLATRVNLALKAANVSVSSTAAELTASLARRRKVYIRNLDGNQDVFLGGSGVSTTNGYLLQANEELWIDLTPNAKIYAIKVSASPPMNLRVLEAGV